MTHKIRDGEFDIPDLLTLPPDGGNDFNRLIFESSPYLLQHARNPVDWYPWCDAAFERAQREDKPIFLSIGYSTCHWCHVMEHESFEDAGVADFLRAHFISIKLDREERPDVDHMYMSVCQAMTGSGGWPLTIFMTPQHVPFFAGTYFPKESRYGRPGFLDLLKHLHRLWSEEREKIDNTATQIMSMLKKMTARDASGELQLSILQRAADAFAHSFDPRYGGFGGAPKFPMGHVLSFLLRRHFRTGDGMLVSIVEKTLTQMYRGGMYDHLGFGFARYSTDERWFAPHFEKMLYDNALLLIAYSEALLVTRNPLFERVAREICEYVLRDMTDATGGFYSAENADSEGREGLFYVWTRTQIIDVLGKDEGEFACAFFGVEERGNWEDGANILTASTPLDVFARARRMTVEDAGQRLEAIRAALFNARARRIHPSLDDKILTSWNGLMIAALAIAGRAMNEQRFIAASERAATFLLEKMRRDDGTLLHRFRAGAAGIEGFLEDYAYLTFGLIELSMATLDMKLLDDARELNETMLSLFLDDDGALLFSRRDDTSLITSTKDSYDGALPSGNSIASYNCIRLARMTGDVQLESRAMNIVNAFARGIESTPSGHAMMLIAYDFAASGSREIVLAGTAGEEEMKNMQRHIDSLFLPDTVVLFSDGSRNFNSELLREYHAIDGKATAYMCRNFACERPVTTADALAERLAPPENRK